MLVCLGEYLLRLKPPGKNRLLQVPVLETSFGGSEANTAAGLIRLGHPAAVATVLPDNPLGKAAHASLLSLGVDVSFIRFTKGRMGLYFLEEGALMRPSQVVYDRSDSSFAKGNYQLWNHPDTWTPVDGLHISGITPAVSEEARDFSLLWTEEAFRRGLPVSIDLNYRSNLWQWGEHPAKVLPPFLDHASLLLSNENDLFDCLGFEFEKVSGADPLPSIRHNAKKLFSIFPRLQHYAVSLRQSMNAEKNIWSGALASRDGSIAVSRMYDLTNIVDRVGAGDAFGAGIIAGIRENLGLQPTVDLAAAFSALKHSIVGDVCFASRLEAERLVAGDESGRIRR